MKTPVAVFAYNRAKHLELALKALENSLNYLRYELPVYIFCDAERSQEHTKTVNETKQLAQKWALQKSWFYVPRENNLGFKNITSGIDQLTNEFGSAIIIEDDVIVAPDFLTFMVKGLKEYENSSNVFMISGFMYALKKKIHNSTFFLNHSFIWGWATWQRAWKNYDPYAKGWENFLCQKSNTRRFNFNGGVLFSNMLLKTLKGQCNTWDIQWMYTLHKHNALALYPHQSLVWNCGVGGGMHGKKGILDPYSTEKEEYVHGTLELEDFFTPRLPNFSFPEKTQIDEKAFLKLSSLFYRERSKKQKKIRKKIFFFIKSIYYDLLSYSPYVRNHL